jgi:hypothetical protein
MTPISSGRPSTRRWEGTGLADDIAAAALYPVSDDSVFVTGI